MVKKKRLNNVQKSVSKLHPLFEPGRDFGTALAGALIISDQSGKLWRIDADSGSARPIEFHK